MLFPKTGSSPNHQFSGFLLLVSGRGNTVIHYKFKGVNTTWWLEIFGSSFGSSQKIAWLRCVFGEISHLDFHVEKKIQLTSTFFFECINKYFYDSERTFVTQGSQQEALSSSGANIQHGSVAKLCLLSPVSTKVVGPATMAFLKALVEVKILEHLRERDLESTSNVPFGGGRCKWGCWLFGGGCWMIVDICQDGCFWGVGFDAIRDLSIFASWLFCAVSNLWVGVTFLLTIPMVTRLTRWRFFWCQGNLCLLGWSFLQRIAQKCGSC